MREKSEDKKMRKFRDKEKIIAFNKFPMLMVITGW